MKKLMNENFPADILKSSLLLFTKCCTFCFLILSIFISSSVVFAATIYVGPDPDDNYVTIQDAINASSTGDTILVADGTYYENILFNPSKTNITLISENGPVSTVIYGDHTDSVVTFAQGIDAILDGFTITNGKSSYGGGIRIGRDALPTINNCIITNNEASAGGGISSGESSAPLITNSIIEYNTAIPPGHNNGGGFHIGEDSTPTIINCIFKDNYSRISGGAISMNNASPVIVNCIFDNNMAGKTGGAIASINSAMIITNCTFSNNTSGESPGGAISCAFVVEGDPLPPESKVTNSIFWGDHPAEIVCEASIISITYSNIQGGPSWPANPEFRRADFWPGTGNINADPRFLDQLNGDFHLTNDSPCIDAGDNSDPDLQTTDIEGNPRIVGLAVDMGAFEKYLDVASPPTIESGNEWLVNPDMYGARAGDYTLSNQYEEICGEILEDGGECPSGVGTFADYVVEQGAGPPGVEQGAGPPGAGGGGGPEVSTSAGSAGDRQGIFGDILKSSVIGYHLDGWTAEGIEIYMPVTQGFKALKGAQEYVRSFAPALAEFVRECFDYLEQKADANKEGSLYNFGTHVFPVLGKITEGCLRLLGQEDYMNDAYVSTTIGVEEFIKLKKQGRAVTPNTVKDSVPAYFSMQELVLTSVLF